MERFSDFAQFMNRAGKLKRIERTGWVRSGIQNPESVADHSFRTTLMALVLGDRVGINTNKAIRMALVHDLAESLMGDLTPSDPVSPEQKYKSEQNALNEICADIDNGQEILDLWEEFEEGKTKAAKFVRGLDKLEMMFQAHEYGIDQPNVDLQPFWTQIKGFDFGDLKDIFDDLGKANSSSIEGSNFPSVVY